MNTKRMIALYLTTALSLPFLVACSKSETPELGNELQFSLDNITSLTISYHEEPITFYENKDNNLIIKEYMSVNKRDYYAKVNESGSTIKISEGDKPLFKENFNRYVEVYLPADYNQTLTVTSTSGEIDLSNTKLNLSALRIDNTSGKVIVERVAASEVHLSSTSGIINVGSIEAKSVRLDTTSGSVNCDELHGEVNYTTTSGDLEVSSAVGSGSYLANNSGKLNVVYSEVRGDLSFFNKNDDITLRLPAELAFAFEATTKNGSILTDFQQSLTIERRTASGIVGTDPTVTIKVETKDGDAEVRQGSAQHP